MSSENINTLSRISSSNETGTAFSNNFNSLRLVDRDRLFRMLKAGPLVVQDLYNICSVYHKNSNLITMCVYTDYVTHVVFRNNHMLTITMSDGELNYSQTNNSLTTWVRLQNFFYKHTKPGAKLHKRVLQADVGVYTVNQLIDKFNKTGNI